MCEIYAGRNFSGGHRRLVRCYVVGILVDPYKVVVSHNLTSELSIISLKDGYSKHQYNPDAAHPQKPVQSVTTHGYSP